MSKARRLRILTWHVHGNYLWYLSHVPHDFVVPFVPDREHPYGGRIGSFPWTDNLTEIPAADVKHQRFDCILYQSRAAFEFDQYSLLSAEQRRLPRVYLEHDPPLEHPFAQPHCVDDPETIVVHVTSWNATMWDSGRSPVRVIEHGVVIPDDELATYDLPRGICAINHLRSRGRRMGSDIYLEARKRAPVDLVGMDSTSLGGLGEIDPPKLAALQARYRFAFSPIRQTSLGLAIVEAMMIGLPVVGMATCELASVIRTGESGALATSVESVIAAARDLANDPAEASRLGANARATAQDRFNIERFSRDWSAVFHEAIT